MSAYFFTENFFKTNTPVSENVDYQDLKPFIEVAQETIIKARLGKSLYERLMEAIELSNWNSDELELIKLCRKPAMFHTLYMAMPFLQTKIRNKGLVKGTDQFIQTISRDDMKDLRHEFREMTGFYMNKLEEWLCLYSNRYPEYSNPDALNKKEHTEPFDFSGFMTYKRGPYDMSRGWGLNDRDIILKTLNYKWR